MNKKLSKEEVLKKVCALKKAFETGQIKTLSKHEVNPGLDKDSVENLLYFTLPPSINFQRSSPAMWKSALSTYQDDETRYLFDPEKVVKKSRDVIQKDLLKHKLALQLNKHTDIWIALSNTFNKYYKNNPKNLLNEGEFDVPKILKIIQKDKKSLFPFLSGYKLSNYWLYIVTSHTNIKLKNMNKISIIPDTHVIKSTVKLGLSDVELDPVKCEKVWEELLNEAEFSAVELHPVLWNWSRNNFLPDV